MRNRYRPWFRPAPVDFIGTGRLLAFEPPPPEVWGVSPFVDFFRHLQMIERFEEYQKNFVERHINRWNELI